MKTVLITLLMCVLASTPGKSQDTATTVTANLTDIQRRIDSLSAKVNSQTNKIVSAGFSLAYRTVYSDQLPNFQSAYISPVDSTLTLENLPRSAILLSTSLIITPFVKTRWLDGAMQLNAQRLYRRRFLNNNAKNDHGLFWMALKQGLLYAAKNIGIVANVNIAEIAQAQQAVVFNKSIEGGIGFCLQITPRIYVSYANELFFSRQLRATIKNQAGYHIYKDGAVVTDISALNQKDENYYVTQSVFANAFRVIIAL